ncbi:stress response protein NST1 isoform X2 [Eurytemora carolleeae]|uniref:stress response protein NST1 isoform X2 n=1 Tax=Eurytemora carolleeae TaxID=1294199 RepID=UPI000C77901D|nr:stress response protein NST1 isoform X2 [Eurytemora carolleeae]|eukprot:XP_023319639.1 stress response protein NST1-like isoform X2 [Eurytemora affinis]
MEEKKEVYSNEMVYSTVTGNNEESSNLLKSPEDQYENYNEVEEISEPVQTLTLSPDCIRSQGMSPSDQTVSLLEELEEEEKKEKMEKMEKMEKKEEKEENNDDEDLQHLLRIQLHRCKELENEISRCKAEVEAEKEIWFRRIKSIQIKHKKNMNEVKNLLLAQRQVGEQWKDEMRELTLKFDIRLKDSLNQNKTLKARIKQLEDDLARKGAEVEDAHEMTQIYKTRLNKAEKKIKQDLSRNDDSYLELTFPFSVL